MVIKDLIYSVINSYDKSNLVSFLLMLSITLWIIQNLLYRMRIGIIFKNT